MNRRPGFSAVVLALVLGASVALPGAPRDKKRTGSESPETSTLVERATVEMVLIEAYVSDGQGRPIEGLGPNDFVLMVDGHVRPISSLEFRNAGVPPMASGAVTTQAPPGQAPPTTAEKKYPRRFILFYEDRTSSPEGLTAARRATERLLAESLVPDDQVALAVFDRGLRLLHEFTSDRAVLRQCLEASLSDPRRFSDFASEHEQHESEFAGKVFGETGGGSGGVRAQAALVQALNYAGDEAPRVRGILRALQTLIDSLSPYPGFKAIVFMGDGVAENPAFDFFRRFAGADPDSTFATRAAKFDLSQDIKGLANAAAAGGVTLHSVQTAGLSSASSTELRASVRRSNAIETIALNTGGTASTSNDLFKALHEAEVASRAFYVVGYAPDGPPDGQYHTVQLRVRKSGARLRWRRGFTRLLPHQAREHAVQAAYLLPELYADLGVELTLIPGPAEGAGRVADLVIHLPPGRALFVPQEGGPTARMEAGFVVIDATNHETLRAAREAHIALGARKDPVPPGVDFYSRIHLSRAGQTITAVVSDLSSGALGAARLEVPEADKASRVVGLSIYSMAEKSLWVEIPAGAGATPASDRPAEFSLGPALKTTFSIGEPLACGFRLAGPAAGPAVRMVIRNGERVVRSLPVDQSETGEVIGPGAGAGAIKMGLVVEDLPAGDYVLAVQATAENPEGPDLAAIPFRLRAPFAEPGRPSGS